MANPTLKARVTLNDGLFRAGLNKVVTSAQAAGTKIKNAFSGFGAGLGKMAGTAFKLTGILAFTDAVVAGAASLVGFKKAIDIGGNLNDLSAQTGAGIANLMALRQAFDDTGIGADEVGTSLNKVQDAVANASKDKNAAKVFSEIGLQWEKLAGVKPDEQFLKVGAAISQLATQEQKVQAARNIFGKAGGKMLSLFGDSGAIKAASRAIGGQAKIYEDNIQLFDDVGDKLGRAGLKFQGFWVGAVVRLTPTLNRVLDRFEGVDWSGAGMKFGDALKSAGAFLMRVYAASAPIGNALLAMAGKMAPVANFIAKSFKNAGSILIGSLQAAVPFAESIGLRMEQGLAKVGNFFAGVIPAITHLFSNDDFWDGMASGIFYSLVSFANQAFQDIKNSFVSIANQMAAALVVAFDAPLKEISDNFTQIAEIAANPKGLLRSQEAASLDKEIKMYDKLAKSQAAAAANYRNGGKLSTKDQEELDQQIAEGKTPGGMPLTGKTGEVYAKEREKEFRQQKAYSMDRGAEDTVRFQNLAIQKRSEIGSVPRTIEQIREQDKSPFPRIADNLESTAAVYQAKVGKRDPVAAQYEEKATQGFAKSVAPVENFGKEVSKDRFGAKELGQRADAKEAEAGTKFVAGMLKEAIASSSLSVNVATKEEKEPKKFPQLTPGLSIGATGGIGVKGGLSIGGVENVAPTVTPKEEKSQPNVPKLGNMLSASRPERPEFVNPLGVAAYSQSPLLSKKERAIFENSAVARGGMKSDERASTAGAFGVVRSGDAARRKEVERERAKEKLGLDKTNELLNTLVTINQKAFGNN